MRDGRGLASRLLCCLTIGACFCLLPGSQVAWAGGSPLANVAESPVAEPGGSCSGDGDCDDFNVCTDDFCDDGECAAQPNDLCCETVDDCSTGQVCFDGFCIVAGYRMFLVDPSQGPAASAPGEPVVIPAEPDSTVFIDVYVGFSGEVPADAIKGYEIRLGCTASGGIAGSVDHPDAESEDSPIICDPEDPPEDSPVICAGHEDFLFAGLPLFGAPIETNNCPSNDAEMEGPQAFTSLAFGQPGVAVQDDPKYLVSLSYDVSPDADGNFLLIPLCIPSDDCMADLSFFRAAPHNAIIPITADGAIIEVGEGGGCAGNEDCDDSDVCNGNETCSLGIGVCEPGTPLDCDDNDACNGVETCDSILGCQEGTPLDCPDDGDFCNGEESCNAESGCVSGGDPCLGQDLICDEDGESCVECLDNGDCEAGETCTDGLCESGEGGNLAVSLVASDTTPSPGDQIVIEAFVTNNTAADQLLSGYNIDVDCAMTLEAGAAGTVDAITLVEPDPAVACTGISIESQCDPGTCVQTVTCVPPFLSCPGGEDCLDDAGVIVPDFAGAGLCLNLGKCSGVPFVDGGRADSLLGGNAGDFSDTDCGDDVIKAVGVLLGGSSNLAVGETKYLGTFLYTVSGDASGTFTLPILPSMTLADEVPVIIDPALIDFEGASITVQGTTCGDEPDPDGFCDDNDACNGEEMCNLGTGECEPGTPLVCDDNDACNGVETCDSVLGCQDGTPLVCDDNDVCNGVESCDSGLGCQDGTPLVCDDNDVCNGVESCDSGLGCQDGTPLMCDDDLFCNGDETCDSVDGCQPGPGNPCSEPTPICNDDTDMCEAVGGCEGDEDCVDSDVCNGNEICNTDSGLCEPGTPLDCPDDGLFCTGTETCDSVMGCVQSGDPCLDQDLICDEDGTSCVECLDNGDCEAGETCTDGLCESGEGGNLAVSLVASDTTPSAGDQIVIEAFVTNNSLGDQLLSGYNIDVDCAMTLEAGAAGTVDAITLDPPVIDVPCTGISIESQCGIGICLSTKPCVPPFLLCPGGEDCLDDAGVIVPDFAGAGLCEDLGSCSGVPFVDGGRGDSLLGGSAGDFSDTDCSDNVMKAVGVLLGGSSNLAVGETKYLGTFLFSVSGDASGTFTLPILTSMTLADDVPNIIDPALIDFEVATIVVQSVPCDTQGDPDGFCNDDDICNGEENCNLESGVCQPGTPLDCDDNDACNGEETCDSVLGCQDGAPLVCDDGVFCNGLETCDPLMGCEGGVDPCPGLVCLEASDTCGCDGDEDCDDGDICNGLETCDLGGGSFDCVPGTPLDCPDDDLFCTGDETCDSVIGCVQSGDPCVGQELICKEDGDSCVECLNAADCDPGVGCFAGMCIECIDDSECDDGVFCNGQEACVLGVCLDTNDPCEEGVDCDEDIDTCIQCTIPEECDDGLFCTGPEFCIDFQCVQDPEDLFGFLKCNGTGGLLCDEELDECFQCTDSEECDDGQFCNGDELCAVGLCFAGAPQCVNSAGCDEVFDECLQCLPVLPGEPDPCDDGLFCNGEEKCELFICFTLEGTVPCEGQFCVEDTKQCVDCFIDSNCNDGLFCTGEETCVDGACVDGEAPCPEGVTCDEAENECVECVIDDDCPDDGEFCTGDEFCDNGTCASTGNPCPGGQTCLEPTDECFPCVVDDDCDDNIFCNGAETCDAGNTCQPGGEACPGQLCDEIGGTCVDCLNDDDCDDGLFCTPEAACFDGACVAPGGVGVVNGTFDGSSGWANNIPVDGAITFDGALVVTGPASGDLENPQPGFTWASQSGVILDGANLEFDLVSYPTPEGESGSFDYPVFFVNGVFYGLNHNGTLGSPTAGGEENGGTIVNDNPASNVHFVVNIDALGVGPGPYTIGFGVNSDDGAFAPGVATFDNITPAFEGGEVCPGEFCDENLDECVACLIDDHCDNGVFCDGAEVCDASGACQPGAPACPGQICIEANDSCVDCENDLQCSDLIFCNGVETCSTGFCQPGNPPCPPVECNEANDTCGGVECDEDGDCDDGLFCNGAESCDLGNGSCQSGIDPCPGQTCDEGSDTCGACSVDADCADGVFCNGEETCDEGDCVAGGEPCGGLTPICDEDADACVECDDDGDCDDNLFCNGSEACAGGACQAGTDPCSAGLTCDEANDLCTGCTNDPQCDDGLFCNGEEACNDGTCGSATSGVVNGTIDDATGWSVNNADGGSITLDDRMSVTGPDTSNDPLTTGGFTWASQSGVDLQGADLEFDLVSYIGDPNDILDFDYPVFFLDGTFYGLNPDGTLSGATNGGSVEEGGDGGGDIDNGNPASNVHFVVDIEALAGPGSHTIGFGVNSHDGLFGPGVARFDNIAPALVGGEGDACPGQVCDEDNDVCVDCLTDAACDDGVFCNGAETCTGGSCQAGELPCPLGGCNELTDSCAECMVNADCADNLFCNGVETCDLGICLDGAFPCPGQACDEASDTCGDCSVNADCDDGVFCNGEETCDDGDCVSPGNPCGDGTPACDEVTDACVECLVDADCDDELFCSGVETCDANGDCQAGDPPCDVDLCDEIADECAECNDDGDCDDSLFCTGEETCNDGECVSSGNPCTGQGFFCNEDTDLCLEAECLVDNDCGDSGFPFCMAGECVECIAHDLCSDGIFCNGKELCVNGSCEFTAAPCSPAFCDEANNTCPVEEPCVNDVDCTNPLVPFCHQIFGVCVSCVLDSHCSDGAFCNGEEMCRIDGICETGEAPCSENQCDETNDLCALICQTAADCDDDVFCNGAEVCNSQNFCEDGVLPCASRLCDESAGSCDECLTNAECDDGVFCNGAETCTSGDCTAGSPPCGSGLCDEQADQCVTCVLDSDCDDGVFCNGAEVCVGGSCQGGADPCSAGQTCDEVSEQCSSGVTLNVSLTSEPTQIVPAGSGANDEVMLTVSATNSSGQNLTDVSLFVEFGSNLQAVGNSGIGVLTLEGGVPVGFTWAGANLLAGGTMVQSLSVRLSPSLTNQQITQLAATDVLLSAAARFNGADLGSDLLLLDVDAGTGGQLGPQEKPPAPLPFEGTCGCTQGASPMAGMMLLALFFMKQGMRRRRRY